MHALFVGLGWVPASHAVQLELPRPDTSFASHATHDTPPADRWPAKHALHTDSPSGRMYPGSHATHWDKSSRSTSSPAGQASHRVPFDACVTPHDTQPVPPPLGIVPGRQDSQATAPSAANFPGPHATHRLKFFWSTTVPASHGSHAVPFDECVAGQNSHTLLPSLGRVPWSQSVHVVLPAGATAPGPQCTHRTPSTALVPEQHCEHVSSSSPRTQPDAHATHDDASCGSTMCPAGHASHTVPLDA